MSHSFPIPTEKFSSLSEIEEVCQVMREWTLERLVQYRKILFAEIGKNRFLPKTIMWPRYVRYVFWKKPMATNDVFKLLLFFLGNKLHVTLAMYWILSSTFWSTELQARATCRQINYIFSTYNSKGNVWFYFDMMANKVKHINGSIKHR